MIPFLSIPSPLESLAVIHIVEEKALDSSSFLLASKDLNREGNKVSRGKTSVVQTPIPLQEPEKPEYFQPDKFSGNYDLGENYPNLEQSELNLCNSCAQYSSELKTSQNIDFSQNNGIGVAKLQSSASQLGKPISIGNQINKIENLTNFSSEPEDIKITRLVAKSRQGENREFEFIAQVDNQNQGSIETANVVEVVADEQEYLDQEEIIKAKGNVVIRFSRGILSADEVMVNLPDRIAVATGNVILTRGDQTLRGKKFEYYFVQDKGVIFNAEGVIYQPNLSRDFGSEVSGSNPVPQQPLSWQFEANQPLQRISTAEGFRFSVGSIRDLSLVGEQTGVPSGSSGGTVNRIRFEAEKVNFDSEGWNATNIRFTNDPFSPPEVEVRADTANLKSISPFMDELTTTNSRLVFDQTVSLPLFQDRLVFDRRQRRPGLFNIGFDGEDRGGLYIERSFNLYTDQQIELTLTPQFLLQRAFFPDSFDDIYALNPDDNGDLFNPSSYGLVSELNVDFDERTELRAIANFTGLDLDNIENRLRAQLGLNHKLGNLNNPYRLGLEYNFRERMFNGSLGFQTVQQSIGGVVTSPYMPLGDFGLGLTYQGSIQTVTANTDRQDLLATDREDNLVTLTRFQTAALLSGGFFLWIGDALPPTPEEGLKYTSTPVSPFLKLNTGLTGVASYYTSGDSQPSLTGTIGLEGQFGHFSNPFLDYTGFNVSYSQGLRGDPSPFFFDRFFDTQVLSFGLTQQLYGPVRAGVQSFLNVVTNQEISTDYFIEYSRRTYNIILRYNPVLEIGSINLRISDFNWDGKPAPFGGTGISPVVDGVTR